MWWHRAIVGCIRAAAFGLGAVVLLAVAVGGCDTAPEDPIVPPASAVDAPPATSDSTVSERDAVIASYEEFWQRHNRLRERPASSWRGELAEVAVNPQLKITLQGMRFNRANGITTYGAVRSRITKVIVDGNTATVSDCQDASRAGKADLETGEKKTVGVSRNPVRARLERVADGGEWKVAKITFPGGDC